MDYLLTVIVPVYNMEKYLEKTLDSLVNQTFKPLKILVCNDGSTDSSVSIVEKYQEKYPNVFLISQENGGIASCRNFAIKHLDTEYFGFLDSDDYVELDMFEKMYHKITENNSDICVCDFYKVWPDKQIIVEDGLYSNEKEMIKNLYSTLWNKIYRSDLLNKYDLSFLTGYRYEDSYFLYTLAANSLKIARVNEALVYYIQRNASITHNNNEKVRDMIYVFKGIRSYYQDHQLESKFQADLEFIFIKFFLGNNFLRACQINDSEKRNEILKLAWDFLNESYPNFKKNPYLDIFPKSRKLFVVGITEFNYRFIARIIHLAYRFKGSDTYG